jgi:hypothetical protein
MPMPRHFARSESYLATETRLQGTLKAGFLRVCLPVATI